MNISKIAQDAKASMVLGAAVATMGLSAGAVEPEAVQLWEGGPCFATCNVGATKPEESGYYFWWGDTVGYVRNGSSWDAVDGLKTEFSFSSENCPTNEKDDEMLKSEGWIGDDGNLVAAHDAARAHLGAPWRMMTKDEMDKLESADYCQREWVDEYKGVSVNGWVVKGKSGTAYEKNEVFFPAVGSGSGSSLVNAGSRGYSWSSTPGTGGPGHAWALYFNSSGSFYGNYYYRYDGYVVRAVKDTPVPTTVTVDKVESGDPWSKVTVNYTLNGTDAEAYYKVAFDVTAGGQTAGVTNGAAKLMDGAATKELDTAALFGKQVTDTKAKVKVSLIAINPKSLGGVQLWENGPFFAECNVGATKPEEYGYYFWWGDIVGYVHNGSSWDAVDGSKTGFSFSSENCPTYEKDAEALKSEGWIGDNGNLVAAHDAARAHLGAPWRMMTKDELDKLESADYCQREWVAEYKGVSVDGWVVKGKAGSAYEKNEVFFPAAGDGSGSSLVNARKRGYYWSSTPYSGVSSNAWYLHFSTLLSDPSDLFASGSKRYLGFSVRPVR